MTFASQEKSAVARLKTPTNNRVVDDYLPRTQLKKAYISGECSLEDPTSISNFS